MLKCFAQGAGPGFESRPGALCCVSLPLSIILFLVTSSAGLSIKPKKYLKKKMFSPILYTSAVRLIGFRGVHFQCLGLPLVDSIATDL